MTLTDSVDLLERLLALDLDVTSRDPWWWPESGRFATIVAAILTQQTRYRKVEESLARLREGGGRITPERLAAMDRDELIECIRPSGFYRTKAERLQRFSLALLERFGDFETFRRRVDRAWLLARAGVGNETADAMLCYGCHREAMVVDAYTQRLLLGFGMTFSGYEAVQSWLVEGMAARRERVDALMGGMPLARVYALYHGLIVEYAKRHSRGREVVVAPLSGV